MHGTPVDVESRTGRQNTSRSSDVLPSGFHRCLGKTGNFLWTLYPPETANHAQVTQDVFKKLAWKKAIFIQIRCCRRIARAASVFLPNRYVGGKHARFAKAKGARGDQCDVCGKPLNANELIEPRCRQCGTAPVFKDTEHFFLKLSAFNDQLLEWVKNQVHWRQNVINFTPHYLQEGLKDRAITRDIEWEYTSRCRDLNTNVSMSGSMRSSAIFPASKEWAASTGDPEKWREYWQKDAKSYYFIGKDNIPFHTIIWPAMLMGYGGLNLPYDVPANEFLTLKTRKVPRVITGRSGYRIIWPVTILTRCVLFFRSTCRKPAIRIFPGGSSCGA